MISKMCSLNIEYNTKNLLHSVFQVGPGMVWTENKLLKSAKLMVKGGSIHVTIDSIISV